MSASWSGVVGGMLLVAVPVFAWFAIPVLNRALGRPLDEEHPDLRSAGRIYLWMLKGRAVVFFPGALFIIWALALLAVINAYVRL